MDDLHYDHNNITNFSSTTPKFATRFAFFSSSFNPSTSRLRSHSVASPNLRCPTTTAAAVPPLSRSVPLSPKLQCDTSNNSPRFFLRSSDPSSPRSSSPFSFLKSSLRICTSVKRGQGTTTFMAKCSHTFHFPCISYHVKKQGSLACPLCSCLWKEMPMLSVFDRNQNHQFVDEAITRELATRFMDDVIGKNERQISLPDLKVYNDDEPLASLTPKARFNPIPESDENCDDESIKEFQGFCVV